MNLVREHRLCFNLVIFKLVILRLSVLPIASARNAASLILCFCIRRSCAMVWLKWSIEMPRNHYRLKGMTLAQVTALTCAARILVDSRARS